MSLEISEIGVRLATPESEPEEAASAAPEPQQRPDLAARLAATVQRVLAALRLRAQR